MQSLKTKAIGFVLALAPFFAGLVASVHVHRHEHRETNNKKLVSSCCELPPHSGCDESGIPFDSQDECDDCLLCHFSNQSSWFQPVAPEIDSETISIPVTRIECGFLVQSTPSVYQGRAPPVIFFV